MEEALPDFVSLACGSGVGDNRILTLFLQDALCEPWYHLSPPEGTTNPPPNDDSFLHRFEKPCPVTKLTLLEAQTDI